MKNTCQADHAGTAVTLWEMLEGKFPAGQRLSKQSSALALLPSTALALCQVS